MHLLQIKHASALCPGIEGGRDHRVNSQAHNRSAQRAMRGPHIDPGRSHGCRTGEQQHHKANNEDQVKYLWSGSKAQKNAPMGTIEVPLGRAQRPLTTGVNSMLGSKHQLDAGQAHTAATPSPAGCHPTGSLATTNLRCYAIG